LLRDLKIRRQYNDPEVRLAAIEHFRVTPEHVNTALSLEDDENHLIRQEAMRIKQKRG
jgi:ribosomal protein L23